MGKTDRCRSAADRGADPESVRVERDRAQVAGAALAVDKGLVDVAARAVEGAAGCCALQVPERRPDALAADAHRYFRPGDDKGTREAARKDRPARTRARGSWRRWGRYLRQLVDAPLQQFLVGAQVGQLIGARWRQPCCKHENG